MSEPSTYLGGRLRIEIESSEMRMSHWIDCPRVIDVETGQVMLDLHGSLWHLVEAKEEARSITLVMRRYPGSGAPVTLKLSPDRPGGELEGRPLDQPGLIAALNDRD